MLWKKKDPEAGNSGTRTMTPLRVTRQEIESLAEGQILYYELARVYWGGLGGYAMVEHNVQHPKKGKKYIISTANMGENRPVGIKKRLWSSNKPKEIAAWVLDKGGRRAPDFGAWDKAA
jgi:hypothetical protein